MILCIEGTHWYHPLVDPATLLSCFGHLPELSPFPAPPLLLSLCAPRADFPPTMGRLSSLKRQCSLYGPLLFSAVFCFIAAYWDGVWQVLAERRAQQVQWLPPLPDVGHSVLPHIRWWKLNDLYIALFALITVIHFIPAKTLRPKVLRRFLFLEAVILLLRGVSVVLTTLSIPLRDCQSDALGNPFIESFYIFI